jgi:hypothetical protein
MALATRRIAGEKIAEMVRRARRVGDVGFFGRLENSLVPLRIMVYT